MLRASVGLAIRPGLGNRVIVVVMLIAMLGAAGGVGFAATSGYLDPTFGDEGQVTTRFEGYSDAFPYALIVQDDNKLVAVGAVSNQDRLSEFALARYLPDGALDEGFGQAGRVTTDLAPYPAAFAVVEQDDGKLVTAGDTGDRGGRFAEPALARYLPDGSLDESFGQAGVVIGDLGADVTVRDLALQENKLVVAGSAGAPDGNPGTGRDFALVRYREDGTLDETFGSDGLVTTPFGAADSIASASAVIAQDDGKLVAAGASGGQYGEALVALARYLPDGSLDARFGQGGRVTAKFDYLNEQVSLAMQPDGKLVVAATASYGPNNRITLIRYLADGSRDPGFGDGGLVTTGVGDQSSVASLVIQPDGKLVAGGASVPGGATLVRYMPDGSLDRGFGEQGRLVTDAEELPEVNSLALQGDGKFVAASFMEAPQAGPKFVLTRLVDVASSEPPPPADEDADACPVDNPPAPFSDRSEVPEVHRSNVDCVYSAAIARGFADGSYRPTARVRRDQMAAFLARTLDAADTIVPAPSDQGFSDIAGNPHADDINRLAAADIVRGTSSTTFNPAGLVQRDQIASFVLRATAYAQQVGLEEMQSDIDRFYDVPAVNVHRTNINGAAELGLVHGRTPTVYDPAAFTRRDQMASFLIRTLESIVR